MHEKRVIAYDAYTLGLDRGEAEEEFPVVRLDKYGIAFRKGRADGTVDIFPLSAAVEHLNPHIGVPSSELLEASVMEGYHIYGLRLIPGVSEVVLLRSEGLLS